MTATHNQVVNQWCARAIAEAARVRSDSARLVAWSRELRQVSVRLRRGEHPAASDAGAGTVAFRLKGVVAGQAVEARWTDQSLTLSEELLTRADLVVRLGEVFTHPDGPTIPASLTDGPLRALLTVMRACDVVHYASIDLAAEDRPGGRELTPI